jgi:hypothetical protein
MDCFRVFSRLTAFALLLAASPGSLFAEEARGGPADPTAKTLPTPHDAGPFAAYLDPRLRGEGPDAIERSDFEQARKVSSPAPASPGSSVSQEGSLPSSAHEGHVGHESGGSSKDREVK